MDKVTELRQVIANESLPISERRDAAAYAVRLQVEAVPESREDDPEVVGLMQAWPRNTKLDSEIAAQWSQVTKGRSTSGWSQADALAKVSDNRRIRVLLAVVVDEGLDRLERLAAAEAILTDHLSKRGNPRNTALTAERLLETAKAPDATKWNKTASARIPVSRPPEGFNDVWE